MVKLITPAIKDEILSFLVANYELNALYSRCDLKPLLKIVDSKSNIQAVFKQFERLGLISNGSVSSLCYSVSLNVEAHDFLGRGGFVAQEEILKANINRLGLELENLSKELEPEYAEKASKITTIAASIATVLGFFKW